MSSSSLLAEQHTVNFVLYTPRHDGMKKPLSNMTPQEFVEFTAALGLKYKGIAEALGKSQACISKYISGERPIPLEVGLRIEQLVKERVAKLRALGERISGSTAADAVGSLIVYHNERKPADQHHTLGRLLRRQHKPDTRVFPAYRMSLERYQVYVKALSLWQARILELAKTYTTEAHQRDYRLEMADIKLLADTAPRHAPYDILIEHSQWDVVSRALRHYATLDHDCYRAAHALRSHWWKYRGSGYPVPRKAAARG
jgi:predicted transcriptional regulator